MGSTADIVRRASIAGWVVGGAGLVALVTIGLFFWIGDPFGMINDLALIVVTAAIPFLMLAYWELGGLTPTPLALVAQIGGWIAAAVWCVTQLLFVLDVVSIDYAEPATGAYAIESVALIVIGLWISGANLLAGQWLSGIRWLGVVTGAGLVVFAVGALVSGSYGVLGFIGGPAYVVLLPVWGVVMGRSLGDWRRVRTEGLRDG
ncbi:MAG TPA: hypothetical protein VFW95_05770 [Candidatus Limnocylindria bacterium]|nr:hypothetical protein [Candidatus Limnocylindria bacterium]